MNNLPNEVKETHKLIENTLRLLEKEKIRIKQANIDFKEENLENLEQEINQFEKLQKNEYLNEPKLMGKEVINAIKDMNKDLKNYNEELEKSEAKFYEENSYKITIPIRFEESMDAIREYKMSIEYDRLMFGNDAESKAFQESVKDQIDQINFEKDFEKNLESTNISNDSKSKNKSFFLEKMKSFFKKSEKDITLER